MSNKSLNKIRVGLLLDSYEIPAWAYLMIKEIISSDYAKICLTVINSSHELKSKENGNLIKKIIRNQKDLCYFGYRIFEKKRYVPKFDLFEIKNCKDLLQDSDEIIISPIQKKFSDTIQDDDVKKIEEYDLGVLIRLGFRILKGKILNSAKFGVWSYHNGDNQINRGGPAGFWEVVENIPYTGIILQILDEDLDNGKIIYKSFTSTDPLYVNRNQNNLYWKNVLIIPRKLKELQRLGKKEFIINVEKYNSSLNFYDQKLYKQPTNRETIRIMLKHVQKYLKIKFFEKRNFEQWGLLFDLRDGISQSLWRFKRIIPPKDRFFAEPFVVEKENQYFIFIEEFFYNSNKGRISLITMNSEGKYSKPTPIIEKPYHLSYPNIFEYNGTFYMIPESSQNNTIEIYKCKNFPFEWEFSTTIMDDIKSLDNTLFNKDGKWWLFSSIPFLGASPNDELSLFYSNNPLSKEWTAHPHNPIVSDVRKARSGGKIFEYNGSIYRPSQDCSGGYGRGLIFNKINELNEFQFKESRIGSVYPNWDKKITGIHTFAWEKQLTVFDARIIRNK